MDGGRYNFPSDPVADPKAVVTGGRGSKYRFTVLTDKLLRYEWSDDGGFEDRASTFAICRRFEVPSFRVIDAKDQLEIITDYFHVVYDKKEFTPEGLSVVVPVGNDTWRYDEKNFGDLGGTARTLDGADGRIPLEPGILSQKPYAALDDSESMLFSESGWIAPRMPNRKDGYVFAYSGDHKAAIKDFYRLSGAQPLLPRWALGNWWSRYHAYSADEYLTLMNRFEDEGIPLTVGVIDMDWHKVDIPPQYGSGWTGYSWNRDLFPDPEGFLAELHRKGLRVTVNDHPADGIRAFEDQYYAVAKALNFDTSHGDPIRFDCTDKDFMDAYFDVLKYNLEKQGVDFWWVDWQQGSSSKIPGIDPLWVLNHYHYLTSRRNIKELEQPLTFSRFAGPGSHRYPIGFSGDTIISWASLDFQPEFTATASNIGYGWWSHDIGGHYWGTRSNELTARWVQLGCFSPVLRLHSEKSQWNSKAPWKYEREAAEVMKEFLILRHRMIPFLFTMNVRASHEGEPIIQPMYWNHKEKEAKSVPNQYYFGPRLIVAPITSPHSPTTLLGGVRAWLPPGRFVDIFNPGLVYDGNREVRFHRTLSQIPVLAKEGTILPLDSSPITTHGVTTPSDMEVLLVVGADASFELVEEEDPVGGDASRRVPGSQSSPENFVRTPITWSQSKGVLKIGPASKPSGRRRKWTVRLVGHTNVEALAPLPSDLVRSVEKHSTIINLGSVYATEALTVELGEDIQLDIVDVSSRLHEMLYRCESGYQMKETVWQLVTEDTSPVQLKMAKLYQLDIESDLRDAIVEIWLADQRSLGSTCGNSSRRENSHEASVSDSEEDDYVLA